MGAPELMYLLRGSPNHAGLYAPITVLTEIRPLKSTEIRSTHVAFQADKHYQSLQSLA